jgi:hypothetical protein
MIDAERYRDALMQLGLHKASHQDGTLLDHMFRACGILQDMRAEDDLCLAMLFHGVYGSEARHGEDTCDIPDDKRATVRAIVGSRVEQLIFNFSVMSYSSLGNSFRRVMRPNGQPELKDWRTGGDITLDRNGFEELLRMKLGDVLAHMPRTVKVNEFEQSSSPVRHAEFWKLAAEHLGPDAVNTWDKFTDERLRIETEQN